MGHIDALYDFDKPILQYGSSCADSVDCNRSVVVTQLAGIQWVLATASSWSPSCCALVCFPLLPSSIELTIPCLFFYWGFDVNLLLLGGNRYLFNASTGEPASCKLVRNVACCAGCWNAACLLSHQNERMLLFFETWYPSIKFPCSTYSLNIYCQRVSTSIGSQHNVRETYL